MFGQDELTILAKAVVIQKISGYFVQSRQTLRHLVEGEGNEIEEQQRHRPAQSIQHVQLKAFDIDLDETRDAITIDHLIQGPGLDDNLAVPCLVFENLLTHGLNKF